VESFIPDFPFFASYSELQELDGFAGLSSLTRISTELSSWVSFIFLASKSWNSFYCSSLFSCRFAVT